jgi:hypothetical protein
VDQEIEGQEENKYLPYTYKSSIFIPEEFDLVKFKVEA